MSRVTFLPNPLRRRMIRKIVEPYTLVGHDRIRSMYDLARRIESENIPGDVVECGVCNGGTAAIMGHFATRSQLGRTLWLLDSFEGMPETTAEDGERARPHIGKEVGDISRVRAVLGKVDADMARVRIVKGWFQETFPRLDISQIALLNIDADWYASVRLCLDTFYDRVSRGGFISIDDYGHWPGCRQAVEEFFRDRGISPELHVVDYTARWFQKM
jgi:Macrocin-O-methyltransferase (TylF)